MFKLKIHFLFFYFPLRMKIFFSFFFPPWIKIFFHKNKNKQNYLSLPPPFSYEVATGILSPPLSHSQFSLLFLSTFSCVQGFRHISSSCPKHKGLWFLKRVKILSLLSVLFPLIQPTKFVQGRKKPTTALLPHITNSHQVYLVSSSWEKGPSKSLHMTQLLFHCFCSSNTQHLTPQLDSVEQKTRAP